MIEQKEFIEIVNLNWNYDYIEDDEDSIVFENDTDFIDRLFLEKESGMLSIGRQFQYDEGSEVCNKVAGEMFLFEKAFELILKRNSEYEVSSWHDMIYDLGYPGTDYDKYVGFERKTCTPEIIRSYQNCMNIYEKRIKNIENAIDYLLTYYIGEGLKRSVKVNYNEKIRENEHPLEICYEGEEYFLCRIKENVYVSDLLLYKKVNFFFSECTLNFYKEVFEDKLYFVSDNLEVVIDLHKADKSYLEVEQKVIRYKQRSNMIAMTRLFDNGNLETVKIKTDIQFREEMKLTTCIIKACITLVQNSLYRNASENYRNDYLRDILGAMGIDVRDQTRTGLSATKKSAGQADLVVYKGGVPNSFLEALNLSGMNSSYIKEHIQRIFEYDQIGLPVNYLICYVKVKDFLCFLKKYTEQIICANDYKYEIETIENNVEIPGITVSDLKVMKMSFVRNNCIVDLYNIILLFK